MMNTSSMSPAANASPDLSNAPNDDKLKSSSDCTMNSELLGECPCCGERGMLGTGCIECGSSSGMIYDSVYDDAEREAEEEEKEATAMLELSLIHI